MFDVVRESERRFRLIGELDIAASRAVVEALSRECDLPGDLWLDLSDLVFLDSTGIRSLISVSRALEGRGRLVLARPTPTVRRVLDIVRADTFPNVVVANGDDRAPGR